MMSEVEQDPRTRDVACGEGSSIFDPVYSEPEPGEKDAACGDDYIHDHADQQSEAGTVPESDSEHAQPALKEPSSPSATEREPSR